MSSMLEQAIIDAATLREAALKNAEQSLIEKYAPKIKEAVESMLENDGSQKGRRVKYEGQVAQVTTEAEDGMVGISLGGKTHLVNESEIQELSEDELLQEEDMDLGGDSTAVPNASIEAPFVGNPNIQDNETVHFTLDVEKFEDDIEINLSDLERELAGTEMPEEDMTSIGDLAGEEDLDTLLGGEEEPLGEPEEEEEQLQELLDLLGEYDDELIEEEIEIDYTQRLDGWVTTQPEPIVFAQDMELAAEELNEDEDSAEEEDEEYSELAETINLLKSQNKQLETVVYKLNDKLDETLLSNAKLIYQNRTLCDASLNERQKEKIVEAIAKAESPKEAKHLQETLRTTVGSKVKKGPKSLSESVNRKSNLSGMLNRRQNLNKCQTEDPFLEKMQRLAGIK